MRYLIIVVVCLISWQNKSYAQCDLELELLHVVCDDNGTPTDPLDDVFFAWLQINGTAFGWATTDAGFPEEGGLDGIFGFGPYSSANGPHLVEIYDSVQPDCFFEIEITPALCDPNCSLFPTETNIVVDNNGTTNQCSDDQFSLELTIDNSAADGSMWQIIDENGDTLVDGVYGVPEFIGPLPLFQENLELNTLQWQIQDAEESSCTFPFIYIPLLPEECRCELFLDWEVNLDDGSTIDDCSDDLYFITINVGSIATSNVGWTASDNFGNEYAGAYNEPVVLGPYIPTTDSDVLLVVRGTAAFDCNISAAIDLPDTGCSEDFGDVSINFSGAEDCMASSACLPLIVSDFENILGLQLSINYSDNLLYQGVQNFNANLLGFTIGSVGHPMPFGPLQPGNFTITWNDPLASGVSLVEGDTLFEICFQQLNDNDQVGQVFLASSPTLIEIINSDEMNLTLASQLYEFDCNLADLELDIRSAANPNPEPETSFTLDVLLRNSGLRQATGVIVHAPVPAGYTLQESNGVYDPPTGNWAVNTLEPGIDTTLRLQLFREASGDSMFLAEVSFMNEEDADSTPGNGVDTDDDEHVADDSDDEDDGDGWLPCPVQTGTLVLSADTLCSENALNWSLNNDAQLPDNYLLRVALYDNEMASPSQFLAITEATSLDFSDEWEPNRPYYLRLVAGPDDGSGNIDFSDNCVRAGLAHVVIWTAVLLENCPQSLVLNCYTPTVMLTCTAQGIGPLNYEWYLNGDLLANDDALAVAQSGNYELIVTDSWGCSATHIFNVIANITTPDVVVTQEGSLCGPEGEVLLQASGGTGMVLSYLWSTGEVGLSIIVTEPGLYSVEVFDEISGCSTEVSVLVPDPGGACNLLRGRALRTENCLGSNLSLANWLIEITGENFLRYQRSDALGQYEVFLPNGDFTVKLFPYSPAWELCEPAGYSLNFSGTNEEVEQDLTAFPIDDCPLLEVSTSIGNLRRCANDRTITVHYENVGTDTLQDGYLAILLPEELTYSSTTGSFIGSNGDSLFFSPSLPLAPGASGQFTVYVDVSCSVVWGSTVCVQTLAIPYGPCPGPSAEWGGASLLLGAICTDDEVIFTLNNVGSAPLSPGSNYIIIQDGVMLFEVPEEVPTLLPGEDSSIALPANGSTYILEAEQEPFHPGFSNPILAVEGCDMDGDGDFSTGFVTTFPNDDDDFYRDIDCGEISAAYDPNDKEAEPVGYGEEHYISSERSLEYKIRFQNTGNDTAQTVVIRDTLSEWLDMSTFRLGVSSHFYRLELDTARVVTFVFENILLPDSTTNFTASQGFVGFSVRPLATTPLETRIENTAAIYFDVNPPIFTNTTFHTIGQDFVDIINGIRSPSEAARWSLFPNPNVGMLNVEWESMVPEVVLLITDAWGREQGRHTLRGGKAVLDLQNLQRAWYGVQLLTIDGKSLGSKKLMRL